MVTIQPNLTGLNMQISPKILRAKQAADYLSISKSQFYEWVAMGVLPKGKSLGKRCVVWHVDTLDQFIDEALND